MKPPGSFVVVPLLALLAAVPVAWGWGLGWADVVLAVFFYCLSGLGVTIGFHRCFTHGAFRAARPLRLALAVAGSLSMQGPIIAWVADHRRHHAYADKEGDPHSPWRYGTGAVALARGFWHAHLGWLFDRDLTNAKRFAPDLLRDRGILRVNRLFPVLSVATLLAPALLGGLVTWSWTGALTAFFWAGLVRVALLHHITWSVNSVCHLVGERPFRSRDRSANFWPLAIASFGESWHNSHHADPTCARHGRATRAMGHLRPRDPVVRAARLGLAGALAHPATPGETQRLSEDSTTTAGRRCRRNVLKLDLATPSFERWRSCHDQKGHALVKPKLSRSLEVTGQVLTGATFAVLFGLWGSTAGAREAKASVKPRPAAPSCLDSGCRPDKGGRELGSARAYGETRGSAPAQSEKFTNNKPSSPPKKATRKAEPKAPRKKDDRDNERGREEKDGNEGGKDKEKNKEKDRGEDKGDERKEDKNSRKEDNNERDRGDDDEGDRGDEEGDKPNKGDKNDEGDEPKKEDKPDKANQTDEGDENDESNQADGGDEPGENDEPDESDEGDQPAQAVASPPDETADEPPAQPAAANDPADRPATPATPRTSAPIADRLASGLRAATSHTQPPAKNLSFESQVVTTSSGLPDQELTGADIPTTRLPNGSELSNLGGTYYLNGVALPADLGTHSPSSLAIDFDHWLARWAGNIQWQELQGRADAAEILLGAYCDDQPDACGPSLKNSLTAAPPRTGLILREMGIGAVFNALKRLAGHGPKVPPLSELAKSGAVDRVGDFGGYQLLLEHFSKHAKGVTLRNGRSTAKKGGADMPEFTKPSEYLAAAREFMGSAKTSDRVLESVRVNPNGGVDLIRVDPETGYFGIRDTLNGRVKTFFRPDGDPVAYFNEVIKP